MGGDGAVIKHGTEIFAYGSNGLMSIEALRKKRKKDPPIDEKFRIAFKQYEDLFGTCKISLRDVVVKSKLPENFRIIILPAVKGDIDIVKTLIEKKKLLWNIKSIPDLELDLGISYDGMTRVYAIQCTEMPNEDTRGVPIEELSSRNNLWAGLRHYLLAFSQNLRPFDTGTGTCFPSLMSHKRKELLYCQYDEFPQYLTLCRDNLTNHPKHVGARLMIELPLVGE